MRAADAGLLRNKIQCAVRHFEHIGVDQIEMRAHVRLQFGWNALSGELNDEPGLPPASARRGPYAELRVKLWWMCDRGSR
jgi:hypothetical protein